MNDGTCQTSLSHATTASLHSNSGRIGAPLAHFGQIFSSFELLWACSSTPSKDGLPALSSSLKNALSPRPKTESLSHHCRKSWPSPLEIYATNEYPFSFINSQFLYCFHMISLGSTFLDLSPFHFLLHCCFFSLLPLGFLLCRGVIYTDLQKLGWQYYRYYRVLRSLGGWILLSTAI